jgi:DNA-binding NarL/FixJ family response regulator
VKALPLDPGTDATDSLRRLTLAELEVMTLVARGLSNDEIAHKLGKQSGTVKLQVSSAIHKLGVSSRVAAAVLVTRAGMEASRRAVLPPGRHALRG